MKRNIQHISNPPNICNCFYSYNLSDIHYMNVDYMRKKLYKVKYEYNKGKYIIHNTEIESNENKDKKRNEDTYHLYYKYKNKHNNQQLKQETIIQSLKYSKRKPFMKVSKDLLEMTKKVNHKRDLNDKDKEINELNKKVEDFKKENELLRMNNNKSENCCESELIKENEVLKCKYLELEKEVGGLKEENELLEKDLKMKCDKVSLLDNKLLELNEVVCKKEEEIKLLKTEIDENKRNEGDNNLNTLNNIIKEETINEPHNNINSNTQHHNEEDIHITNINNANTNNEVNKNENNNDSNTQLNQIINN